MKGVNENRYLLHAVLRGIQELSPVTSAESVTSTTSIRNLIRRMVRFLRRHGCSQGQALTLGGVAETFVALNRGPRVEPMDIWSG
jgi:hypothetical protein